MNRIIIVLVMYSTFVLSGLSQTEVRLQEGLDGYSGTTDTTIFEDATSNALGGSAAILVGSTATSQRRGLLRFDVSSIPQNAEIESTLLQLNVDAEGNGAQPSDLFTIFPLLMDWGEGIATAGTSSGSGSGFGAAAANGDATWESNHHTQSKWSNPGGDFNETPVTESQIVNQSLTVQSEAMTQTVQQWVEDSASNFGWIIIGNESSTRTARRLTSSEGSQTRRPLLQVTYQVPVEVESWDLY